MPQNMLLHHYTFSAISFNELKGTRYDMIWLQQNIMQYIQFLLSKFAINFFILFDWGVFELYILNYIEESTHKVDFSIVAR